jgi:hypothetical protein
MHEEVGLHNAWFSDEVCYHLDGIVYKQNVGSWLMEIHISFMRDNYGEKITL